MPVPMREAYIIWACDCLLTLTELDDLPMRTVEMLLLIKAVHKVATDGGTLNL